MPPSKIMRALAVELAPAHVILVNAVSPGVIVTAVTGRIREAGERGRCRRSAYTLASSDEVAGVIASAGPAKLTSGAVTPHCRRLSAGKGVECRCGSNRSVVGSLPKTLSLRLALWPSSLTFQRC